jgi:hypothetical protein
MPDATVREVELYDGAIMMSRAQITLDNETHRRARKRAAALGVSFAEYIRSLVARDLASPRKATDRSILFALGRSAGSDVAANKDAMIAEAFSVRRSVSVRRGRTKRR